MHKKLFLLAIEESEGSIYIFFKSVKFRMVINYSQSKARRSWRRMTRLSWPCRRGSGTSKSSCQSEIPCTSLGQHNRATPPGCAGGRYRPLKQLWPPMERPACPCGGRDGRLPSRPSSQPTQPPSWGCPRARRATQTTVWRGKFPLGGSVGRMVGLPVGSGRGIDFLSSSALSRAVCACWPSGFANHRNSFFGCLRPLFVPGGRCAAMFVCAFQRSTPVNYNPYFPVQMRPSSLP